MNDLFIQLFKPVVRLLFVSNLELNIGISVNAVTLENATAAAIAKANSVNNRPILPCKNTSGTNTAINTKVVAITAKPTSRAPRYAASKGGSPSSMRREMFSSTTMASSTTKPIARTSANKVSRLIEKPSAYITVNAATKDTGTVTAGMIVARTLPKKR